MSAKLTVDGIKYTLDTEKTLLENLEENAIAVEFHCRDGHCGACKCHLDSGSVEYKKQPMAYLRQGEVLPCCSTANNDVVININGY